jgi:hypothetical protein
MTVGDLREVLARMPAGAEVLITLDMFSNLRAETAILVKPNWRDRTCVIGVNQGDLERDWSRNVIPRVGDDPF